MMHSRHAFIRTPNDRFSSSSMKTPRSGRKITTVAAVCRSVAVYSCKNTTTCCAQSAGQLAPLAGGGDTAP